MRIFHFCQYKVRHSNGVQSAVWELATAQAELGQEVEIVSLGRKPSPSEVDFCAQQGIRLSGIQGKIPKFRHLKKIAAGIRDAASPVCHLHSVFIPWQSFLGLILKRRGIPYFISPHGNIAPGELRRKPIRKWLFVRLIEKRVLRSAAGFLCASEREATSVRSLLGNTKREGRLAVVGNCVNPQPSRSEESGPRHDRKARGIFLGKSDVRNKAFDRMFEVAQAFPGGVDFYVIPHNQPAMRTEFDKLVQTYSGNKRIRIREGVHGEEKRSAIGNADVCLHLARWEVFGMAIVEAAMNGLALVLSSECDIAPEAEAAGAAYVMRSYDAGAIGQLRQWIEDTDNLRRAGERAREWALARFSPAKVAASTIAFYQSCLASP